MKPTILLGWVFLFATGLVCTAGESVFFKGETETERVRVLGLIEGCRDLDSLVKRIGTGESVRDNTYQAPLHPDERCGTGDRSFQVRTVRFTHVSKRVDLDVIVFPNGSLGAAAITEKLKADQHQR